jgi:(5-formylfuran-3-yl)methyl phosphate synthase
MRLLVSVRSAGEVAAAISGGADIIDAKEPDHGSLGAVSAETLWDIAEQVPGEKPFSAALGDFTDPAEVDAAISGFPHLDRRGPLYLKLGFAGMSDASRIRELLATAGRAARHRRPPTPLIIGVAYGDWELAGTARPELVCHAAVGAGAAGLLLDTQVKLGTHLLDWIGSERLAALVARGRGAGLLTAVAGGLGAKQLQVLGRCGPDVVGFRGAVCAGGRTGRVSRARVAAIRRAVVDSFSLCSGGSIFH